MAMNPVAKMKPLVILQQAMDVLMLCRPIPLFTTLSLPLSAERDSLLSCETSDLENELEDSREDEYTINLNEDAGTTSNNADSNNEAEDSDSEVDNSSDFEFAWCDIHANFVEPDLPDFQEPVGVTSEASSVKSPLEYFKLFLHLYCYPF